MTLKGSQPLKKKRKLNRYSFHLARTSFHERSALRIARWCTYVCEFIPALPRVPLLGPTSQYRMHFRSRPTRFAIPFVLGSFSRQILLLAPTPFYAGNVLLSGWRISRMQIARKETLPRNYQWEMQLPASDK